MYHVIDLAISETNKQVRPSIHTVQTKSFSFFDFEYKRLYLHPLFGTDKTATVSEIRVGSWDCSIYCLFCVLYSVEEAASETKIYETFEITNKNRFELIKKNGISMK